MTSFTSGSIAARRACTSRRSMPSFTIADAPHATRSRDAQRKQDPRGDRRPFVERLPLLGGQQVEAHDPFADRPERSADRRQNRGRRGRELRVAGGEPALRHLDEVRFAELGHGRCVAVHERPAVERRLLGLEELVRELALERALEHGGLGRVRRGDELARDEPALREERDLGRVVACTTTPMPCATSPRQNVT
jgi:hypothetical protein